ncbi:hypothetical protein IM867_11160 [Thermobifida fusca]|nr:hypothetical protein IM867_11160 [Thermobifida fusca]
MRSDPDRAARAFCRRTPGWKCRWIPESGVFEAWTFRRGQRIVLRDADLSVLEAVADGRLSLEERLTEDLAKLIREGIEKGVFASSEVPESLLGSWGDVLHPSAGEGSG